MLLLHCLPQKILFFINSHAQMPDGKFMIKNVKPGNYILMTTHPYFADLLEDIEVKEDVKISAI